ncbi:MAG: hypothetical protein KBC12_03405 [Candidatus Pacebacteria bacterium]|nr:hypothetical protein [Candidatus Paceibacterota bacterium]
MSSKLLDSISFWSIFVTIVFLPVFLIPFVNIPVEISKSILLVSGLTVSIISWAMARFSDGEVCVPKSKVLLAGLAIVLATFFSAYFSEAQSTSFFGLMFDVGTFWFMLVAFLFMLFASLTIRTKEQGQMLLRGFFVSSLVVLFLQTLRYFLPDSVLSLGAFRGGTANTVGTWNSFGFFSGLVLVASVFVLEFIKIQKKRKPFLYVAIALSIFSIMAVNLALIWELLGVFSILLFVTKIYISGNGIGEEKKTNTFPKYFFAVAVVVILFFLSGRLIGNWLPGTLGLFNNEISPSLTTTIAVGKSALSENPFLGFGANRFLEVWAKWKPITINDTQFRDAVFNSGSGFLPTMAICTGILGILAWLVFVILLVINGVKFLVKSIRHKSDATTSLFFVLSVFMFTASFFYSIGIVGIMLAFGFMGVFIGQSALAGHGSFFKFNFLKDPRNSFFAMFLLVAVIISSAGLGFKFIERSISVFYFNKTLVTQDPNQAESFINKAMLLNPNDLYFRTYSEIKLARLVILFQKKDSITPEEQADLQNSFAEAERGALLAVNYNTNNYLNHQMLGVVYSTAGGLGVSGAQAKAIEAYLTALKLNPLNPGLRLSIAREYIALGEFTEAKKYAEEALGLAPHYTEALFLLSDIKNSLGAVEK